MSARVVQISCELDLENTVESFHAYSIPTGIEIRPGDVVTIENAPTTIDFGSKLTTTRPATVHRAGPIRRGWTRAMSVFDLTSLYEVGFESGEHR